MQKARLFLFGLLGILGFLGFLPPAAAAPLTYQFEEHIWQLEPKEFPTWRDAQIQYFFRGREIELPEEYRKHLPKEVNTRQVFTWDRDAITQTLEERIGTSFNREAGSVKISREVDGTVVFEGQGLPGRKLNVFHAAELTRIALEQNIRLIQLPVDETPPLITITDPALQALGVREVVTVGESDFTGSPANRRNNIAVGLQKFNGHLIPQGAEFSFNEVLGPVSPKEGYRKELTIMGERTLPEYGGGLCQVSTTAFRGVWKAGFPILARRNHSFAVRYYSPPGTDATIYPPWTDLRFSNDTDGALLVQTFTEGNTAYFLYYGTKPRDRTVELVGPFVWDVLPPPEDRVAPTTDIPPGERRIVGTAVPGMKALWYRYMAFLDGVLQVEPFFSQYEARPNFEEIGVEEGDPSLQSASATILDRKGKER